eukprot:m.333844 g.333844  ORF g.333844 m.333844 type:complete len:102 (-) comp17230_c0_seq1:6158-6463(-)
MLIFIVKLVEVAMTGSIMLKLLIVGTAATIKSGSMTKKRAATFILNCLIYARCILRQLKLQKVESNKTGCDYYDNSNNNIEQQNNNNIEQRQQQPSWRLPP